MDLHVAGTLSNQQTNKPFSIHGREAYLRDFIKKNNKKKQHIIVGLHSYVIFFLKQNISLYLDIYRPISVKLDMTIETYILISVWIFLTFIRGHSCMRNHNFGAHFFRNLGINLIEMQYAATTCCFDEAHAKSWTNLF